MTTHKTHNRKISMPPAGFELTISSGERPQTYTLDRGATMIGNKETLYVVNREMDIQIDLEKATYGHYWNCVRVAVRETSRNLNFALVGISLNSIHSFLSCAQEK